ncbi:MAG: aminotransferase class IV [Mariprofundaceae bacterium]|nr:aminotransferase class IV [Mariprofundaceae bacterium]
MNNMQKNTLTAWVNGSFLPLELAVVHIEDRGFQFADGVYEVVACVDGVFLDLDAHLARLESSCAAIAIVPPFTRPKMAALVKEIYDRNPFSRAMVYIQVTRGAAPRAHYPATPLTPTVVLTSRVLPQPSTASLEQGYAAITRPDIRWKHCEIKSIALLASIMGKQEAHNAGVDETFWLDQHGHVLEGCSTNVFAVIDDVLVTHPLDHQVLGGITRDLVLRLACSNGVMVSERPWRLDETGLTECMLSSTTNAVMPVCRIDQRLIAGGKPHAVALQLRAWVIAAMESPAS